MYVSRSSVRVVETPSTDPGVPYQRLKGLAKALTKPKNLAPKVIANCFLVIADVG